VLNRQQCAALHERSRAIELIRATSRQVSDYIGKKRAHLWRVLVLQYALAKRMDSFEMI